MKTLTLNDATTELGSVGNRSGSIEAQECDPTRFHAGLTATYEVPSDPPPIIELCATGVGFDGTESKNCIRYYTGEVWEGEIHASNDVLASGACDFTLDGPVMLTVGADGAIDGTADVSPSGCGGIGGPFQVEGHATSEGFVLTSPAYFMHEVALTRTGNQATGPTTYDDAYNHVVGRIEVTCATCDEL